MFSITIKLMKKSARMLIPAGIAILIGTAFIAATFLFSNSMDDSLRRQRTAQLGEANYIATMKTNSNGAVSENGSADRTTTWSGCRRQGGRRSDIQRQRSERHRGA